MTRYITIEGKKFWEENHEPVVGGIYNNDEIVEVENVTQKYGYSGLSQFYDLYIVTTQNRDDDEDFNHYKICVSNGVM